MDNRVHNRAVSLLLNPVDNLQYSPQLNQADSHHHSLLLFQVFNLVVCLAFNLVYIHLLNQVLFLATSLTWILHSNPVFSPLASLVITLLRSRRSTLVATQVDNPVLNPLINLLVNPLAVPASNLHAFRRFNQVLNPLPVRRTHQAVNHLWFLQVNLAVSLLFSLRINPVVYRLGSLSDALLRSPVSSPVVIPRHNRRRLLLACHPFNQCLSLLVVRLFNPLLFPRLCLHHMNTSCRIPWLLYQVTRP